MLVLSKVIAFSVLTLFVQQSQEIKPCVVPLNKFDVDGSLNWEAFVFSMLSKPNSLALSESQQEKLMSQLSTRRNEIGVVSQELKSTFDAYERQEIVQALSHGALEEMKSTLNATLTESQKKRLQHEVVAFLISDNDGKLNWLNSLRLNVSRSEEALIRDKLKDIRDKIYKLVAKLKREHWNELLEELPSQTQELIKENQDEDSLKKLDSSLRAHLNVELHRNGLDKNSQRTKKWLALAKKYDQQLSEKIRGIVMESWNEFISTLPKSAKENLAKKTSLE